MKCGTQKETQERLSNYGAMGGAVLAAYLVGSRKYRDWNPISKFAESMTVGYLGGYLIAPLLHKDCLIEDDVAMQVPALSEYGSLYPFSPLPFSPLPQQGYPPAKQSVILTDRQRRAGTDPCWAIPSTINNCPPGAKCAVGPSPNPEYSACREAAQEAQQASKGIPTWAWVAGGLGLGLLLARK
jgi:hypothetical protein